MPSLGLAGEEDSLLHASFGEKREIMLYWNPQVSVQNSCALFFFSFFPTPPFHHIFVCVCVLLTSSVLG